MKAWCETKKKDLEVIIQSINYVLKLREQTSGDWVKCLKQRTKKNPEEVKTQIHETLKQVLELSLELVDLEKVVNLEECTKWHHFISAEIVEKY